MNFAFRLVFELLLKITNLLQLIVAVRAKPCPAAEAAMS